jgi:ketosteroid isomerase-like protein
MNEIVAGNAEPLKGIYSHRGDVTVSGGFGGHFHGWEQVEKNAEFAASRFKGGQISFENVSRHYTHDLAYSADIELGQVRLTGREDMSPLVLRVTIIFRREDGVLKLVHRHADPISSIHEADSLIQK